MTSLLDTFYGDLNKLKLDQFPCGVGNWRLEQDPGYVGKGEVNQETLLSLEELAQSEVFSVQTDWSNDIASLRHLAVQNPHIISESFIFQHFTSLRLVDRNINEVDKGLLKFTNLEELSLTGNSLTSILGSHLPRSLKSLHLVANKFEELNDLTVNPPPNLQHLGVGYNTLSDVTSYISPYHWPNLLSLDLSNNKISSLRPTLECLSSLPSLRNLSLMGNPVTLAPGYAGCTLDLMPHLQILDDVSISDDDRLLFSNISQMETVLWDQAIFCVSFPALENLRQPPANEPVDEAACVFPVQKKFSYLIKFAFLSDTAVNKAADNTVTTTPACSTAPVESSSVAHAAAMEPPPTPVSIEINSVIYRGEQDEVEECHSTEENIRVFESVASPWEESSLSFLHNIIVRCSDLLELESFLAEEIQFTVVEKVVESFTAIAPPDAPVTPTPSPGNKKKGKDDKKKKKEDPAHKVIKDKDGNILKWVDGEPSYSDIAHIRVKINDLVTNTETSDKRECVVTEKPPAPTPAEDGRASCASTKGKKKGASGAVGGKKKAVATPVPTTPPEPLLLEYKVERVRWSSVEDCERWIHSE